MRFAFSGLSSEEGLQALIRPSLLRSPANAPFALLGEESKNHPELPEADLLYRCFGFLTG